MLCFAIRVVTLVFINYIIDKVDLDQQVTEKYMLRAGLFKISFRKTNVIQTPKVSTNKLN